MGSYDPDGLGAQLADLERRLRAVENSGRLAASSLTEGAFVVTDADGVVKVRMGLLDDGTYGLEQVDAGGMTVSLSAIALGTQIAYNAASVVTTSTSWVDLGGPEVTVVVPSAGRVEIEASSLIFVSGVSTAEVGFTLDGVGPSGALLSSDAQAQIQISGTTRLVGLAAGTHTFRLWYRSSVGASVTSARRTILVRPY